MHVGVDEVSSLVGHGTGQATGEYLPSFRKTKRVWASVVFKALRYELEGLLIDPQWCRWGLFPKLPTEPCALGSTQLVKMSTRKTTGGEDGRCVRVRNLPPL